MILNYHLRKAYKKIWLQQIPTDNSGSFCDRGYSYRNVFFYETPDEEKILKETKNTLEKVLNTKVHAPLKKKPSWLKNIISIMPKRTLFAISITVGIVEDIRP